LYNSLVEELKQHEAHTVYVANKEDDGILHYYLSSEFPMLTGFDVVITRKLREIESGIGLTCGHPVAYCKLKLLFDESVYMGVYFADVGERFVILDCSDFPKLPKEDQE